MYNKWPIRNERRPGMKREENSMRKSPRAQLRRASSMRPF